MEVKEYDAHVTQARLLLGTVVGASSQPLHVGHTYRAALEVPSLFAGLVKGKLEKGGFKDVVVYDDAGQLPSVFGDLATEPNADHWAEGVWNGEPEATPDLPSQVLRVRDDGGPVGPPTPGQTAAWWKEADRIKAAADLAGQILDRVQSGDAGAKSAADELAKAVQAARDLARAAHDSAEKQWQNVLDVLIKARDAALGAGKTFLGIGVTQLALLVGGWLLYQHLSGRARDEIRCSPFLRG